MRHSKPVRFSTAPTGPDRSGSKSRGESVHLFLGFTINESNSLSIESINANAMPTEKKVWGVRGGFGTPQLQGENAAEPTIARIHTDFSSFSCSLINANAMPTLCQRERQILPRNANAMSTEKRVRIGKLLSVARIPFRERFPAHSESL